MEVGQHYAVLVRDRFDKLKRLDLVLKSVEVEEHSAVLVGDHFDKLKRLGLALKSVEVRFDIEPVNIVQLRFDIKLENGIVEARGMVGVEIDEQVISDFVRDLKAEMVDAVDIESAGAGAGADAGIDFEMLKEGG